jgi:endonuclease YncB( thermonuclease family)
VRAPDGLYAYEITLAAFVVLMAVVMLAGICRADGYRFADVVVESVIDGDTIRVSLPGVHPLWGDRVPVRINGIDTPEIKGQCDAERAKAIEARNQLAALLTVARRVDLEECSQEKYGRLLCRVVADRRDAGAMLVEAGLARRYEGGRRAGWCP